MGSRDRLAPARCGFTLMEIMVALALGGMILVGAHAVLTALADEEHALARRTTVSAAAANGLVTLRALVGRLEVGTPQAQPFAGTPAAARFTSWCDVPPGWLERCTVTLAIDTVRGSPVLAARFDGQRVVLLRGVAPGGLRYLESAAGGGTWFRQWGAGISAPLAIGVIRLEGGRTDTLLVRIGARG